jgi:hypothetical protein
MYNVMYYTRIDLYISRLKKIRIQIRKQSKHTHRYISLIIRARDLMHLHLFF